jgi:O-antigen/teichoic acid export membrane protein
MWREVGRDTLILSASVLALVPLQAAFRLLSIHYLDVPAYGRVVLLISLFNTAFVLTFGIPPAASRLAARSNGQDTDRRILVVLGQALALPTAVASIAILVASLVVEGSILAAAGGVVGMVMLAVSIGAAGYLRGKGRIWHAAAVQPANGIAQLVVLVLPAALGFHPGSPWVLLSFYIGNVMAGVLGVIFLWGAFSRLPDADSAQEVDPDANPRSVISFSAWMTSAALATSMLLLLPRIALAFGSYKEVAFFDLALVLYTIPQRLTSALVLAIIPSAAKAQRQRVRVAIPSRLDAAIVAFAVLGLAGVLWWSEGIPRIFDAIGIGSYAAAEPVLLILLIALPAEVLFGINSALLQAFGRSRRLAYLTGGALLFMLALTPFGFAFGGTKYFAALVAITYWLLYLVSPRSFDKSEVREERVFKTLAGTARSKVAL